MALKKRDSALSIMNSVDPDDEIFEGDIETYTEFKDPTATPKKGRRLADIKEAGFDTSPIIPIFLAVTGMIICTVVLVESYLQRTGSPLSLLLMAHKHGYLSGYEVSNQPNRGIWLDVGISGSVCFFIMMFYSLRKRVAFMREWGSIRLWLDFHMFLGILGAILITAHTNMKIGGIVSVSYWSMIIVASSGIIGRYLYGWIPHKVSGQDYKVDEIRALIERSDEKMGKMFGRNPNAIAYFDRISAPRRIEDRGIIHPVIAMFLHDLANIFKIIKIWFDLMRDNTLPTAIKRRLFKLIRKKSRMLKSRNFLSIAQRLLHHWHVFHKPLAVTMFIVMFLHIAVWFLFRVNS